MYSNNVITLNEAITLNETIATTLAQQPGDAMFASQELDASIGLAAIELAEHSWLGRQCQLGEFLRKPGSRAKTLGVIGMNAIGEAIVQRARLSFGMDVIYCDSQPLPEIEAAYGARFVAAEEVLRQADQICVVLPHASKLVRLITRHFMALKSTQTIAIAWQRALPVERAAIYLGEHYSDCIRLDDLAAIADLGKFRLVRMFSATLGITPHHFQLLLRVSYARELLHQGVESREIAYLLGFSDQSHFGRCFRNIAGITPGQYQKAYLDENLGARLFSKYDFQANVANF